MAGSWMTSSSSLRMTLLLTTSDAPVSRTFAHNEGTSKLLTLAITVPKFQGENFYKNKAIVDEIKKLATRKGCAVSQIALAWVAAQGLITIPGTTKTTRLEENWASRDIELSEDELKHMRHIVDAAKPTGERFSAIFQSMVGH